jgi:LAS superfamily LD-carboxypeptidase LdcB
MNAGIACAAAGFLRPAFAQESAEEIVSFPEAELVGQQRPELFGDGFNLRREAATAFDAMRTAAAKEGIQMYSISSYRTYDHQKKIWDRKFSQMKKDFPGEAEVILEIIRYSTIPGTSRHHWGTDLDIIDTGKPQPPDVLAAPHFQPGGVFQDLYAWLNQNAQRYGFYKVYTNDPQRPGFAYEPWHWSYAALSIPMLEQYTRMNWRARVAVKDLVGVNALTPEFLQRYEQEWILGINPALLPESMAGEKR